MKIQFSRTERGFAYGQFTDHLGATCSIQESSLASRQALWLGVEINMHGTHVGERMELTRDQVETLIPLLQGFVKTGKLPTGA